MSWHPLLFWRWWRLKIDQTFLGPCLGWFLANRAWCECLLWNTHLSTISMPSRWLVFHAHDCTILKYHRPNVGHPIAPECNRKFVTNEWWLSIWCRALFPTSTQWFWLASFHWFVVLPLRIWPHVFDPLGRKRYWPPKTNHEQIPHDTPTDNFPKYHPTPRLPICPLGAQFFATFPLVPSIDRPQWNASVPPANIPVRPANNFWACLCGPGNNNSSICNWNVVF